MDTSSNAMPTRVKERALIEFLTVKKVTSTETHRHLKVVHDGDVFDRNTVNRWVQKFRGCESGKVTNVDVKV